jgi:gamma-glutamyltranspeptidase/glutathione hydrolase
MHLTQHWEVRKPAAVSRGGIVASQQRSAAEIGAEVLMAGGTAVDAVIAAAFALAVVEPWNSGLGGVGFMVVQLPGMERAVTVDFGPRAPARLDPAAYPLTGSMRRELFTWPQVEGDRNMLGPLSFAVPSAVAGYALAHRRFGRMPWRDLVSPAVALANTGLPVDWFTTIKVAAAATDLRRYDESRRLWLPDGLPPVCPADRDSFALPLGRLRDTLERLAAAGPDDFYSGDIARAIDADSRDGGGFLDAEDLRECRARVVPSLEIAYRGATFAAAAGLTAGPTLARVLAGLAERSFAAPDAGYFTTLIALLQEAYRERLAGLGDSESRAETCTTHVTAADRDGGIAALTVTLLSSFGSRYVLPRTGILMNNGIMWFDPRPGQANSIAPGKRALTNMCPLVVAKDGRPWFGIGASGGRRILPAVLQMASFIVDFGMSPEAAAHHPRIDASGPEGCTIDLRFPAAIREPLGALPGAAVLEHTVWPSRFACPNLVLRGPDGLAHGISDVMSPWSAAIAEPEA